MSQHGYSSVEVRTAPRHGRCPVGVTSSGAILCCRPRVPKAGYWAADCVTGGGGWVGVWPGVHSLRLENPGGRGIYQGLVLSALVAATAEVVGGGGGRRRRRRRRHSIPAHERLSRQSLFRQDGNKMSLLYSTAHSISTASALLAWRTPQGAHMLSTPSPPRAGLPPLPGSLPQAPAAPVALAEAAVKHTWGLLSWPSPVL